MQFHTLRSRGCRQAADCETGQTKGHETAAGQDVLSNLSGGQELQAGRTDVRGDVKDRLPEGRTSSIRECTCRVVQAQRVRCQKRHAAYQVCGAAGQERPLGTSSLFSARCTAVQVLLIHACCQQRILQPAPGKLQLGSVATLRHSDTPSSRLTQPSRSEQQRTWRYST